MGCPGIMQTSCLDSVLLIVNKSAFVEVLLVSTKSHLPHRATLAIKEEGNLLDIAGILLVTT